MEGEGEKLEILKILRGFFIEYQETTGKKDHTKEVWFNHRHWIKIGFKIIPLLHRPCTISLLNSISFFHYYLWLQEALEHVFL